MTRLIQNPITENSKSKLRAWWKKENNLNYQPREKTIMENLGIDTTRETYHYLADLYNQQVEETRRSIRRQKERNRREAESFLTTMAKSVTPAQGRRIERYPRIVFRELGKYINWWDRSIGEKAPFALTLKSGIAEVQHTYKFQNIHHFRNWYARTTEQQLVEKSDSSGVSYHLENNEIQDLFSNLVIVKNLKVFSVKNGWRF